MQLGQRQHGAYEVSPFYKRGMYSLTAGMGNLGVRTGRFVPITGPPAPDYWSEGLEGLGNDGGNAARKFTSLHNRVLRRRATGKPVSRPLKQAYQKFRAITPGAERPQTPVQLVPHPRIRAKGPAGFLQWFRLTHPVLFARMERERPELLVKGPPAMGSLGNDIGMATDPVTTQTKPSSGWVSQTFAFLDKVLVNEKQKNMAEVNLELAKQGYAPVGFVEVAKEKTARVIEAYQAQPPAMKAAIPIALAAGAVGLFLFMQR